MTLFRSEIHRDIRQRRLVLSERLDDARHLSVPFIAEALIPSRGLQVGICREYKPFHSAWTHELSCLLLGTRKFDAEFG